MNKLPLIDQAARDKIKTCLDQTFLVEAGAGSGKTAGLVDRMIALLAEGKCEPENMAAVTFTRKAAGELKERFQSGLEKRLAAEQDPVIKDRLAEALDKIELTFNGTIHAFCARLLRERPIEAGIAPDFTEIEGLEEKLLEETAWEEYLIEVGAKNRALLDKLDQLDLSHTALKDAFSRLNLYPDVKIITQQVLYPDLKELRTKLKHFCGLAKKLLPEDEPANGWDDLQRLARMTLRWDEIFDLSKDRYLLRLLIKLDRTVDYKQYKWAEQYQALGKDKKKATELGKKDADELLHCFNDFRENLLQTALKAWHEYRHYHLVEFIKPALKRYREFRRRENLLNYQDLLMLTSELLRNNPEVRGYFQKRYTHLLVDEFQDTDPIQAEIMFYLTGDKPDEKDWAKLKPRPGSLFVVGDPKQSIYRFRRADIATYELVKQLICSCGGEVLYLSTNFRSVPELIKWGNVAFGDLFSPINPPYQAEFVAMDHVRKNEAGCLEGLLTIKNKKVSRHKKEQIALDDAEKVAEWIKTALDGGIKLSRSDDEKACGLNEIPRAGDFLVVVRKKENMSLYARALEKNGIAFSLSGGGSLTESFELKELFCLLQALADPENPVPLVAVLRGLFFGISDDLLYRFKKSGGQFSFLKRLPTGAAPAILDLYGPIWEKLKCFWSLTRRLPPSSAIERIAAELGLIPFALSGDMGAGQAGSIVQAIELLRGREGAGDSGFAAAVDFIERLLEEGVEEEIAIDGGSASAVRIINLHKAKGLEAPVVFLANPGNHKVHDPVFHVDRSADKAEGYLVISKKKGEYSFENLGIPPDWDSKMVVEEQYRDAEEIRLLYVGATRAKNLLIISTYMGKPENSPWNPLEKSLEGHNCRDAFEVFEKVEDPDAAILLGIAGGNTTEPITVVMLEKARNSIAASLEQIKASSYKHVSGTSLRSNEETFRRKGQGKGTAWGTLVHAALENLVLTTEKKSGERTIAPDRAELKALAEAVILREKQDVKLKDELVETLQKVLTSGFWQRVSEAEDLMVETPFGLWEGKTYSYFTGIIDLAFRENGQWVLVDYKSDLVEDNQHLRGLVKSYRPQVEHYATCWEQITGENVAEAALYFTDCQRYEPLT